MSKHMSNTNPYKYDSLRREAQRRVRFLEGQKSTLTTKDDEIPVEILFLLPHTI